MKARLALATTGLWIVARAMAATTNDLSDAEIQGRNLARQLLEQYPAENFTNTGVLSIRGANGRRSRIPLKCEIIVTATNWRSVYETLLGTNASGVVKLTVVHDGLNPNQYEMTQSPGSHTGVPTMMPFAGSDFWIADLGLEFFHWPRQKVLKHEMRRGRSCKILEGTNPSPSPDGYSRVVSWIDNETGGIVHAEAYDADGRLLKEFDPKSFKKVNGQWELQDMEIRNVQTGSRTWLEFDLKAR